MNTIIKQIITLLALSVAAATSYAGEIKPDFVDSLIPSYVNIQSALANDDLQKAQSSATELSHMLHHGKIAKIPVVKSLAKANSKIQEADSISVAREFFHSLSNQLIDLTNEVGVSSSLNLWIAHCPMAFDNNGASWIQVDQTVANPYYGKMMLRCGSIKSKAGSKHAKSSHDHSRRGHQH